MCLSSKSGGGWNLAKYVMAASMATPVGPATVGEDPNAKPMASPEDILRKATAASLLRRKQSARSRLRIDLMSPGLGSVAGGPPTIGV